MTPLRPISRLVSAAVALFLGGPGVLEAAAPPAKSPPPAPLSVVEQQLFDLRVESVVMLSAEQACFSGVIVSRDGLVVTSAKSLGKPAPIQARRYAGPGAVPEPVVAEVVARDDWFALLKLPPGDYKSAPLGSTEFLKLNDRVFAVDHPDGKGFQLALGGLGVVTPLEPQSPRIQDALPTLVPYNRCNVGGPVFNTVGELVGILQGPTQKPLGGTKALRVEDVREFFRRHRERVPARQLVISGPAGMEVQGENVGRSALPATVSFTHGDILLLTLLRDGRVCGMLQPSTSTLEPRQELDLGGSQPVGTLAVRSTPPGATLEADGHVVGLTPMQLDCMQPGLHQLKMILPDHAPDDRSVIVRAAEQVDVDVTLRHREGQLSVNTVPPGAEVWVSGKRMGVAPLDHAPMPLGTHVVSLRLPGGARVRRTYTFVDLQHVDAGVVSVPEPGALVHVTAEHVDALYLEGTEVPVREGWYVLPAGTRTLQAQDELGNVLTEQWDAPPGGVRVLHLQGDRSLLFNLAHVVGGLSFVAGSCATAVGLSVLVGIPASAHLLFLAAGGILDALHLKLWIPTLVAGSVLGAPLILVGLVGMALVLMVPKWESLLVRGEVVPPGRAIDAVRYAPTPGWEVRPSAGLTEPAVEKELPRVVEPPPPGVVTPPADGVLEPWVPEPPEELDEPASSRAPIVLPDSQPVLP